MTSILAIQVDSWSVIVAAVSVMLATAFSICSIRQARQLQIDQARPHVVVDLAFRETLVMVRVRNLGRTAARDLKVTFAVPPESTLAGALGWTNSALFTTGVTTFAPSCEYKFLLDEAFSRLNSNLPLKLPVTATYSGPASGRHKPYVESSVLDLAAYDGTQLPDKTVHEAVQQLEKIAAALKDSVPPRQFPALPASPSGGQG
jgi:hypothetical protein